MSALLDRYPRERDPARSMGVYRPHKLREISVYYGMAGAFATLAECFVWALHGFGIITAALGVWSMLAWGCYWFIRSMANARERDDVQEEAKALEAPTEQESFALGWDRVPGGEVYTTDYTEVPVWHDVVDAGGKVQTKVMGGDENGLIWLSDDRDSGWWLHQLVVAALQAGKDPRSVEQPARDPKDQVAQIRGAHERLKTAQASDAAIRESARARYRVQRERLLAKWRDAKGSAHLNADARADMLRLEAKLYALDAQENARIKNANEGFGYIGESGDKYPPMKKIRKGYG
jgi:hypothetical protein